MNHSSLHKPILDASADNLLTVDQLAICEGEKTLVQSVNFSLMKGSACALIGPSGSGKSLTSSAITGLLPQNLAISKGKILFKKRNGELIDLVNCNERSLQQIRGKEIGMIFQDPMLALNPIFSCGHQIQEAFQANDPNNNLSKLKVLEWLDKVQLPKRAYNAYPNELSGGQLQRVMIAIALICNPSLLIADEPTTSLDVLTQFRLLDLIKLLQEELALSLLIITHDINVVNYIANEIIYIDNGITQAIPNDILVHKQSKSSINHPQTTTVNQIDSTEQNKHYPHSQHDNGIPSKITNSYPIISIQQLYKAYDSQSSFSRQLFMGFTKKTENVQALKDITLTIYRGECLGLLGVSGSGKTTLAKIIANIENADTGKINRTVQKPYHIQYIFQHAASSLNPRMKVGDIISEPIIYHKLASDKKHINQSVSDLLTQVGLPSELFSDRYPHQLSGGERQRICIARALAIKPSVLLCDEIWSSLDRDIQISIIHLLKKLQTNHNLTLILISHDITSLFQASDRIIVLEKGKIIEEGEPQNIYSHPKHEHTKALIKASTLYK